MSLLDSFRLDDKVVIVTGASSGLGVAFAQGFAEAGADVVLGARRVEKMADTAALVERAGRRAYSRKRTCSIQKRSSRLSVTFIASMSPCPTLPTASNEPR